MDLSTRGQSSNTFLWDTVVHRRRQKHPQNNGGNASPLLKTKSILAICSFQIFLQMVKQKGVGPALGSFAKNVFVMIITFRKPNTHLQERRECIDTNYMRK